MNLWPGLGKQLGWLISGVSALILLVEWWLALKKDFRWFLWTVSLTIVISQWIGIPTIPGTFHRIDPTTHSYFSIVHRTLASGRTMGSSFYGSNIIYLGMGIVLFRFDQFPTKDAIKPDHSTSFDLTYWSLLGALVGDQTQKIINRGVEAW